MVYCPYMNPLTPEQQKESQERKDSFRNEYIALTEKYQVDFASYPQYAPTPNGNFTTIILTELMDKKALATKSPIQDVIT